MGDSMKKEIKNAKKMLLVKILIIFTMLGSMLYFRGANSASISVASSIVAVAVITTIIRWKKPEAYKKDERTVKLSSYAGTWSWYVSLLVVTALFWTNYLGLLEWGVNDILSIIFFTMTATILGFRFYFMRRGDVQ